VFDADKILERMRIQGSKYDGMTKEEIKEMWNVSAKEAQQQGTRVHSVIERYYKKQYISEEEWLLPEIQQFKQFTVTHSLIPYGVEWCIYVEDIGLAGTIDFVSENEDGTLDLYDWKRTKHMEMYNPYHKYSPIVSHIPDTNFWHYTLQLNLYKYMIERKNKKVKHMYLVTFYPTQDMFKRYEVEDIQQDIPIFLEQLKQTLS